MNICESAPCCQCCSCSRVCYVFVFFKFFFSLFFPINLYRQLTTTVNKNIRYMQATDVSEENLNCFVQLHWLTVWCHCYTLKYVDTRTHWNAKYKFWAERHAVLTKWGILTNFFQKLLQNLKPLRNIGFPQSFDLVYVGGHASLKGY